MKTIYIPKTSEEESLKSIAKSLEEISKKGLTIKFSNNLMVIK